jgi:diguanylate cyclase (GGDEF)-like protein
MTSRSFAALFRKPAAPKKRELRVYHDLIDHLHNDVGSVAGGVIGILILATVSWQSDPDNYFQAIMALIALIGVSRLLTITWYRKRLSGKPKTYATARRWETIYAAGAMSFAFVLGIFGVLVAADPKTASIETLVTASVVGYAGGIAGRNASRPYVAMGQVVATCVPILVYYLSKGGWANYGVAIMLSIYMMTLIKIVITLKRITAKAFEMQRDVGEANEQLDTAISHMRSGLCMMDQDGVIQILNQRARELLRLPDTQYRHLHEMLVGALGAGTLRHDDVAEIQRGVAERREIIVTTSGVSHSVLTMKAAITPVGGTILTFDDITEQTRAAADIERMAKFDSLTGLANRATIMEALGKAVAGEAAQTRTAVLLIDLDKFKEVNDTLGHDVGDKLLIVAADRLRGAVPESASVGRLGGDEFVIVAPGLDHQEAAKLAESINAALAKPMRLMGQLCTTTASIGISISGDHGIEPAELIKAADIALYARKATGRRGHDIFNNEMARGLARRRNLEQDLEVALKTGGLSIDFQPIVASTSDHRLLSCEALARWTHPKLGIISPDEFVPIAESVGLIGELGRYVLREACRAATSWPADVKVSVNVSAVQLRDREGLFDDIWAALTASGLSANRLDLEMTESVLVEDAEGVQHLIDALRRMDISISLDDFGTGYSSLAYVQNYRFDKIKLDKAFARSVEHDRTTRATIAALANIAAATGSHLLLEGVENEAQARIALENGVHELQGFHFGKPMPLESILEKIRGSVTARSAA